MFAIDFDFELGSRVDELRQAVREFALRRIAPLADEIDRSNRFPRELWPEFGEMGLFGMTVPEEYGGLGFGYLEHVVAMEEISRVSGFDRALLRRAFQSLRQPVAPLRHRRSRSAATCRGWCPARTSARSR